MFLLQVCVLPNCIIFSKESSLLNQYFTIIFVAFSSEVHKTNIFKEIKRSTTCIKYYSIYNKINDKVKKQITSFNPIHIKRTRDSFFQII